MQDIYFGRNLKKRIKILNFRLISGKLWSESINNDSYIIIQRLISGLRNSKDHLKMTSGSLPVNILSFFLLFKLILELNEGFDDVLLLERFCGHAVVKRGHAWSMRHFNCLFRVQRSILSLYTKFQVCPTSGTLLWSCSGH